jgi:hypothetical protein
MTTLTTKVLASAKAERIKHGDAGQKKGDKALTGSVRKKVLTAALLALSSTELTKLAKAGAKELHQWIAGVLHHAGCMLASPADYMANVAAAVQAKAQTWDDAQPSMPGPAHIITAAARLQEIQQAEKTAPTPPKKGHPAKGANVAKRLTPPVRTPRAKADLVEQIAAG